MSKTGEEGTNQPPTGFMEDGHKRVPLLFVFPVQEDQEARSEEAIREARERGKKINIEVPVRRDLYCKFLDWIDDYGFTIEEGVNAAIINMLKAQGRLP